MGENKINKTGKDLEYEYRELHKTLDSIESKIRTRAIELCENFPNVQLSPLLTSGKLANILRNPEINAPQIHVMLNAIKTIEEDNRKKANHIQETINWNNIPFGGLEQ